MAIDWEVESKRFDAVAGWYDRYRPSYPPELINAILCETHLPQDGKILEVGSGTGIATEMFARRGYAVHCIEPGLNLAEIARRRFQNNPKITFESARFENWQVRENQFRLVISAQAWHWVPKNVGYAKAATTLQPGGFLALFWNMYPDPVGPVFDELQAVYRNFTPSMAEKHRPYQELALQREHEIAESGYFNNVKVLKFPWSLRYDEEQYLGLLHTYSDHLALPEETRATLFNAVAQVIRRHGSIEKPYLAVLYLARKTA